MAALQLAIICFLHLQVATLALPVMNGTGRSLAHLSSYLMTPLLSLDTLLEQQLQKPRAAALEIDCGEGRALMELQARYPRAALSCLSSAS